MHFFLGFCSDSSFGCNGVVCLRLYRGLEAVRTETYYLYLARFATLFDGYRLVQITDFHLGSFPPGNDFVQKVVDATNNEEPDMILFTGDLVNNQASEVEPYLDTLGQLHASDGIYSIWGIMIIVNMATIILLAL